MRTLGLVQWTMGLLALATLPIYVASFDWIATLMTTFASTDLGYVGFTAARYALCLVIMLPATFCAGMTLPLITRTLIRSGAGEARHRPGVRLEHPGVDRRCGIGGMVLLPLIGVKAMLVAGRHARHGHRCAAGARSTDRRLGVGWLALTPRRARRWVWRRDGRHLRAGRRQGASWSSGCWRAACTGTGCCRIPACGT